MHRKHKSRTWVAAVLFVGAAILFTCGFGRMSEYSSGERGYLRSATYYSDDWVINFWNSESVHMEEELARIAADGFNCIILAVPWREFQVETAPVMYEEYAWKKLGGVMDAAGKQGLGVILRVGYTWDYASPESALSRYEGLLYDPQLKAAWISYAERLYKQVSAYENFCGGFLTWEDFWNFTENAAGYGNGIAGRRMAKLCGYTDYLKEKYTLEQLKEYYGTSFENYEEIWLPEKDSYARKLFYEFYDAFLAELLTETQKVFPDLSMEVRLDADPVKKADKTLEGVSHQSTFGCGNASCTSIMYSVPMGFPNEGEWVTADQALNMAPVFFDQVSRYNGNKPVYVDQFLFTDNTPGFERNARLKPEEKNAYLAGMGELFRTMTIGYGVWTYRDYGDNKLYNPQFALGLRGWKVTGESYIEEGKNGKEAVLPSGSSISQEMRGRVTGRTGPDVHVRFSLEGTAGSTVSVRVGKRTKTLQAGERTDAELVFENALAEELTISCTGGGSVRIDDLNLYTFVTEGDIYRMDGSEGECTDGIRQLNQALGAED